MPRPNRLVHVGNVIVDLVATVPAVPARGADVLATSMVATVGGGFNLMAAAARQGQPVSYAGAHGTGPFGDLARAALHAAGITVLQPARPTDTGVVMVIVDDDGERTLVSSPAGVAGPSAEELAAVRPEPGDAVSVTGYGLLDPAAGAALVPWVRGLPPGVLVVLDPGPLAPTAEPTALARLVERADWCTATAGEAAAITGVADPVRAAAALAARTVRGALVRLGAQGCLLAAAGAEPVAVPGVPVRPVDTTGAGDTHTGVFVSAMLSGVPAVDAARTANAAAAFAVTVRGSATGPTAAELADFLAGPRNRCGIVAPMRFRSQVVLGGKTATGIEVPAEVVDAIGQGKKRVPVTVTIGSYSYRSTIAPMVGSYFVPLAAEHRTAAGLAAGDDVDVDLRPDDAPRTVEVPDDLTAALGANPAVRAAFDALSYSNQRRIVLSVQDAKTDATRRRRIEKAVGDLSPPG